MIKTKYWHECQHCSRQYSTNKKEKKLLNRKIEKEKEETQNRIEN